ncbi:MAG: DUF456 domain-containing protein [Endomicrobium sp.]|jgi:uncharacterized protein YqgC (DUF456 family)|nr:DUF456 domain-containing protein [Endomicrobium sp.]
MTAIEIASVIAAAICMLASFIGCILPVLPGPPLALLSLILIKLTSLGNALSWAWIGAFAAAVLFVTACDYFVPAWGAKKFGGSKAGIWGAAIGMVAGLFFLPAGIILGPFLGALAGELISGASSKKSLKAAFGTFIGFLAGVGLKLACCICIAVYAAWSLRGGF